MTGRYDNRKGGDRVISFDQITRLFAFDTKKKFCVEIQFMLEGNSKFDCCWMGKMWSREWKRDEFWYGLTADGKNAFDFSSFDEMASAPVFDGLSLKEVWDHVVIEEIDGFDPEERILEYIEDRSDRAMMGAP